ncbi:GntR family transcriptional regulator [Nesterenkonia lutea]|uniref:DNA-binding GntR family transcriptional regulator n=1 Tax=Nesterenkonia lutea TaxID=272919 RepID=A0ABR9JFV7_9MICC|nr:GntR family transcriptional regulator [Nesterenkonia lutea]MBE1524814.1 DNA-binding GntR family transcriptional regulator [Nesterenkonia lutea]
MDSVGRGRPRMQERADDIVASVLATAGARVSTPDFSSRRVAELTGLSQTLVSRAFRRIRRAQADGGMTGGTAGGRSWDSSKSPGRAGGSGLPGGSDRDDRPLVLVEVRVSFPQILFHFDAADEAGGAGDSPARGRVAFERRATALMAALRVSEAAQWRTSDVVAPSAAARPPHGTSARWDPRSEQRWEHFLDHAAALLSRCEPGGEAIPGELLDLLARRAGRGLHGTEWQRAPRDIPAEIGRLSDSQKQARSPLLEPERSPRNTWFAQVELSVTEQIAIALRKEITNSGFRAGDRLSPGALAERLGLGRAVVRTAMHRLVDDGLLDLREGSFRVPSVTGADVVDLYAARLHLGMVLLRACAAQPRHRMLPVRLALGAVEAAATQGTRSDVGLADLQFQQELAEASGLSQSARGFHALTLRVRMFIAVLQLDYSPAVERIVSDDRRMLAAVLAGDAEGAVLAWRLKLDNAVRHMSALAPESFDAELWSRLSR